MKDHNPSYLQVLDHPYRILIIGGSGSGKPNALLNLISLQPDINKIYIYARHPHKPQYQLLISNTKM